MDHKFTLKIEAFNYSLYTAANKTFTNKYGDWHVHVSNVQNFCKFIIVLNPTLPVSEEGLKNLKINVNFNNQHRTDFSQNNKALTQCGNSPMYEYCFEFNRVPNQLFYEGSLNHILYSIDIMIDAASISDLVKPPANISANDLKSYTKTMFESSKLADVKLKTTVDKKGVSANKFILSRSPVFDAMLNRHDNKEAQEDIIEIKDIQHEVLVEMLRYMHTDDIPKLKEMALDLLIAADKYDLPGLFHECELHLMNNITNDNLSDILIIADNLNSADLKNAAIKYIIENHDAVFITPDWKSLKQKNVQLGMEVMEQCFQALYKNVKK